MRTELRTVHALRPRGDGEGPDAAHGDADRGDVPGWVMVTMMTAALVVLLWGVAGGALQGLFQQAIARVSGM